MSRTLLTWVQWVYLWDPPLTSSLSIPTHHNHIYLSTFCHCNGLFQSPQTPIPQRWTRWQLRLTIFIICYNLIIYSRFPILPSWFNLNFFLWSTSSIHLFILFTACSVQGGGHCARDGVHSAGPKKGLFHNHLLICFPLFASVISHTAVFALSADE